MGLKDWFAGKVAGPQSYGDVMGRSAREGGSALANMVFMSHGIKLPGGHPVLFDTRADMEAAGFKPRFLEIEQIDFGSLNIDEQLLFRSLQTAMISFAYEVNVNGAMRYMRQDNAPKFSKGLGSSLLTSMVDSGLFDGIETARAAVLAYGQAIDFTQTSTVLNMEKPASGDILEKFIVRAVVESGSRFRYGFCRTGGTGFDVVATPLVEETLKSMLGATRQYKW